MNQLILRAGLAALVIGAAAGVRADAPAPPPAHIHKTADHADPATQTLPTHASARAHANAFGQQGTRERDAHAAATSAAVDAAQDPATSSAAVACPRAACDAGPCAWLLACAAAHASHGGAAGTHAVH
jgi:hypothetical protein